MATSFGPEQSTNQPPRVREKDPDGIVERDLTAGGDINVVPSTTTPGEVFRTVFDPAEHHARTASWSVGALLGILAFIVIGSFVLLLRIEHMEIHYVELWIFSLLALVTVVSRPVLSYLSDKAE